MAHHTPFSDRPSSPIPPHFNQPLESRQAIPHAPSNLSCSWTPSSSSTSSPSQKLGSPSTSCSHLNHDSKFLITDLSSDSNISSDIDPHLMNTLESYAHKGLQSLRIGAINIKRVKFNTPFLYDFLGTLDICCSSDHWLHSFDLNFLDNLHPEFHAWGMSFPNEEDSVYCAPQYQRAV